MTTYRKHVFNHTIHVYNEQGIVATFLSEDGFDIFLAGLTIRSDVKLYDMNNERWIIGALSDFLKQ